MCDCAEERERRLRAARSRGTSPPPPQGFLASLGALLFGDNILPLIGGSLFLMAGLVYKKYEEIKKFLGLGDKGPCDGFEPKSAPEPFKPCRCDT
ncbi:unnamed protein product [Colias eurytheme]|nr:unnamed protein product [Colias eurytheme]